MTIISLVASLMSLGMAVGLVTAELTSFTTGFIVSMCGLCSFGCSLRITKHEKGDSFHGLAWGFYIVATGILVYFDLRHIHNLPIVIQMLKNFL